MGGAEEERKTERQGGVEAGGLEGLAPPTDGGVSLFPFQKDSVTQRRLILPLSYENRGHSST